MDFVHVERAKAMLSGRWIYGCVNRYPYNTCYIDDVTVNGKTAGKYTGVRDDTPWEKLTEAQQKEFVEMLTTLTLCNSKVEVLQTRIRIDIFYLIIECVC